MNECVKYVSKKYRLLIPDRKDLMICIIDTSYVILLETLFSAASWEKIGGKIFASVNKLLWNKVSNF
jgi:hypothetical protein